MIEQLFTSFQSLTPMSLFLAVLGGAVFAVVFNIPARRRLLSRESDSRQKAIRYDALNFIVFYITFIFTQGIYRVMEYDGWNALVSLTVWFALYSASFWVALQLYMRRKDRR